ncbi:restriction endonuclease subunit S [Rhodobacteraceae bacterium M382]|nr:restriction endonuclease subunit S [Rhodobacteraceae bacterium M382]
MSVPVLRFAEFEGAWKQCELGSSVSLQSGYAFSSDYFGEVGRKLVTPKNFTKTGAGSFSTSNTKFTSEPVDGKFVCAEGDLLALLTDLTPSCELLGKPLELTTADGEVLLNQRIVRIDPIEDKIQKGFLKAFMLRDAFHIRMFSTASGTTVRHSSNKVLRETLISLPSLPEQKKIAAFLGVVDGKIAALRERETGLERYKRGLMQALFSQRLRFTQPDGTAFPDWEEKRLGDVATRSTAKNAKLEYMRVLTNSAVQGVIDQGDYFDKDIANADNLAGYYVLKEGDFVYNPRISVSAPVGPIKRNNLGDGVMSPLYTVFRFKEKNTEFFNLFFETTVWHKYMKSVANYGARHDRMAITSGDLMNMPLPYPHPDEQAKIAKALQAMDAKIAAVTGQLERMQDFKKGLLQQMFV